MALPDGFPTAILTGSVPTAGSSNPVGQLRLRPMVGPIVVAEFNTVVIPSTILIPIVNGSIHREGIIPTDIGDPHDWTYEATWEVDGYSGKSFYVKIYTGINTIDQVQPVAASGGIIVIKGPKGDPGADGVGEGSSIPGPANTLAIGTVVAGDTPAATLTGQSPNQTLSLVLPRGTTGDPGPAGKTAFELAVLAGFSGNEAQWRASLKGNPGDQGNPGTQGNPGPAASLAIGTVAAGPAAASIVGSAGTYTLNLTLPTGAKGDPGNPGAQGNPGPAGTAVTLTIGTVSQGPPAATLTGTYPNLILNLTIPKGDTGNAGATNSLAIGTVTEGAAAASITGSAPNQTLNLTVPKGNPGSQGSPGAAGRSVADIAFDGTSVTFTYSDATTEGPFQIKGDTGAAGTGFVIRGTITTAADLPAKVATAVPGDGWVATGEANMLYVRNPANTAWTAVGSIQGPKGDTGNPGSAGVSVSSATFTGTDLTIHLSNGTDLGPYAIKGAKGDPGTPGAKGDPGNDGVPLNLTIGTVTEGAAAASLSGTFPNKSLNLVVPKGATGNPGAAGNPGAKGDPGDDGEPGVRGSQMYFGTGSPADDTNPFPPPADEDLLENDYYIDLTAGQLWGWTDLGDPGNFVWQQLGAVRGANGTKWWSDHGVPVNTPAMYGANFGDFYLNRDTGDVYSAAPDLASWINADINIRGPAGANGTSPTAPSFSIGTVTEGAASASISGGGPAFTLNLVVPKGNPGAQGNPGAAGPPNALSIGTVTQGTAGASIGGSAPNQTLNLVLPKGDPGSQGIPGTDGATIEYTFILGEDDHLYVASSDDPLHSTDLGNVKGDIGPTGAPAPLPLVEQVGTGYPARPAGNYPFPWRGWTPPPLGGTVAGNTGFVDDLDTWERVPQPA